MKIEVYSFGEKGEDKWYCQKDGIRVSCDETIIDAIWWKWIIHPEAERADDEFYTIFKIEKNPIIIEVEE